MNNTLPELMGVVSSGGLSSRMGLDKSLLVYHNKPQRYFLYDLLLNFCKVVLISCNENQETKILKKYNFITDKVQYRNHGPISGLLSVIEEYPDKSILYIGCDYPFLNVNAIENLIAKRNNRAPAICYQNPETNISEPLIAIYENASLKVVQKRFNELKYSLREFLENTNAIFIRPSDLSILKSADTMEEYRLIKESIKKENVNTSL